MGNELLKTIFFVITFSLFSIGVKSDGNTLIIENDHGGIVSDYALRLYKLKEQNTTVIISGKCFSACTMYLEIACVMPDATLGFHSASTNGIKTVSSEIATDYIVSKYPPDLQTWFNNNARQYFDSDAVFLTGEEVIKLGANPC